MTVVMFMLHLEMVMCLNTNASYQNVLAASRLARLGGGMVYKKRKGMPPSSFAACQHLAFSRFVHLS